MRTERIGLVVTPREKTVVRKLAEREGRSMANVIRKLAREEAKKRGIWQPKPEVQECQ